MSVRRSRSLTEVGRTPAAQRLARRLGHEFRLPELLGQALTHRSAGRRNNERLEFLGDALLGCHIAEQLYDRFGEAGEGALSRLRAHLVKGETLAEIARGLDLGEALNLGPGEWRTGGANRDSILAGSLEALIAAIHIDSGGRATRACILAIFARRLEELTIDQALKDPKTRLQEWLQAHGLPLPIYTLRGDETGAARRSFHVHCEIGSILPEGVTGTGTSRRRAEQDAAEQALRHLRANHAGGGH